MIHLLACVAVMTLYNWPPVQYDPITFARSPQQIFTGFNGRKILIQYEHLPSWAIDRVIHKDPSLIVTSSTMDLRRDDEVIWTSQIDRLVWGGCLTVDEQFACITSNLEAVWPPPGLWGGELSPYRVDIYAPGGGMRSCMPICSDRPGGQIRTLYFNADNQFSLVAHANVIPDAVRADGELASEIWVSGSKDAHFRSLAILNPLFGAAGEYYVITDMVPIGLDSEGALVCVVCAVLPARHFDKDAQAVNVEPFESEGCMTRVVIIRVSDEADVAVTAEFGPFVEARPLIEVMATHGDRRRVSIVPGADGRFEVTARSAYGSEPMWRSWIVLPSTGPVRVEASDGP